MLLPSGALNPQAATQLADMGCAFPTGMRSNQDFRIAQPGGVSQRTPTSEQKILTRDSPDLVTPPPKWGNLRRGCIVFYEVK